MTSPVTCLKKSCIANCLNWFIEEIRQRLISPLETSFPDFPLPEEVQALTGRITAIKRSNDQISSDNIELEALIHRDWANDLELGCLFKQILSLYRRMRASYLEDLRAKTFDKKLADAIFQEIDALDAVMNQDWFQRIDYRRMPRLIDFLSLRLVEEFSKHLVISAREFDEKFGILLAPRLFFKDLAYCRAKCEARDTPVVVAFLDIDNFKQLNERCTETLVDRSVLPRLMQTIESHVHLHGFAYRQGGDEYLLLLPNLSRSLTIEFLDELRRKVAQLAYADVDQKTTCSIGFCVAEPDCTSTDKELLACANRAEREAKKFKNCLATYQSPRFAPTEIRAIRRD